METKFTEGKWAAKIQPDELGSVRTINVGSKRIATLSFVGIEESEANARLIESAPELLEMLIKISKIEDMAFKLKGFNVRKLKSEINTVIQQATEL